MLGGPVRANGELSEAKVDGHVSSEVTPAKLKVSGRAGLDALIKWVSIFSPPPPRRRRHLPSGAFGMSQELRNTLYGHK